MLYGGKLQPGPARQLPEHLTGQKLGEIVAPGSVVVTQNDLDAVKLRPTKTRKAFRRFPPRNPVLDELLVRAARKNHQAQYKPVCESIRASFAGDRTYKHVLKPTQIEYFSFSEDEALSSDDESAKIFDADPGKHATRLSGSAPPDAVTSAPDELPDDIRQELEKVIAHPLETDEYSETDETDESDETDEYDDESDDSFDDANYDSLVLKNNPFAPLDVSEDRYIRQPLLSAGSSDNENDNIEVI